MNEKLIKQLKEGKIALHNDGTLEELREVLKYAFPENSFHINGGNDFYYANKRNSEYWISVKKELCLLDLPSYSVKEFLKKETMIDKINDEFIVDCTSNTTEERREVYKFLVDNRRYCSAYLINACPIIVCNKTEGDTNYYSLEYPKKVYPSYPVLTFQEFKQKYLNMEEKKIIGYKLTKPEYNDVAIKIAKIENPSWSGFKENNFLKSNEMCRDYLGYVENLKKAGVLDLWFEAVYEEEVQLPIINGYKGEISGDRHTHVVTYGCAILSVNKLKRILDACNTVVSSGAGNREVKAFVLDSGVEVTLKEIEQIVKYRDAKSI
jgi:hypothetical protein